MKLKIKLPMWLFPKRFRTEMENRSALTGVSKKNWNWRPPSAPRPVINVDMIYEPHKKK